MGLSGSDAGGPRNSVPAQLLTAMCVVVLSGILVAGLWPFHAPKNQVSWLNGGAGLRFDDYGSVVGAGAFNAKADTSCSLEIWLKPRLVDYSGTILAFYWPEALVAPFKLRQSLGDLVVQSTNLDELHHSRASNIYVDELFSHAKPVFVTISSGPAGTAVYEDGSLVKKFPDFRFSSQHLTGQFIIGNAPATTDNWSGQLKGLAFYDRELTPSEVVAHYANWTKSQVTNLAQSDGAVALYLFNEGKGRVVHNQVDSATDLLIPDRFFVLREEFLELPWDEFYGGWSYWRNIAINIAGFIPLGFFFCAYFSLVRRIEHPAAVTVIFGFLVSLTIEVSQAFLPTRDSGTTDLVTNTLGAAIGAVAFGHKGVQFVLARSAFNQNSSASSTGRFEISAPHQQSVEAKEMHTI